VIDIFTRCLLAAAPTRVAEVVHLWLRSAE
jgi:hypothetical protein